MRHDTIKTVLIAFGMTLFFCTSSFGQSEDRRERKKPPTFKELIEEMDTNKDGKLSKDEIKGRLKKDFEKIDTDEDGFITEKEFEKAPKPNERPKRQ